MTKPRFIVVIDIGKTNVKLVLVDLETLTELRVETRPNAVLTSPPYPHFDTEATWVFILEKLQEFRQTTSVDGITVTTHGASAALISKDGSLAAPILDYEHDGPDALADEYDKLRPPFAQTGSPRLGGGLNVGAQLHWQFARDPDLLAQTAAIVTYPQYWGYRLTGALACDVSSLGSHTDLWEPEAARLSSLVTMLGIADKIAPAQKSNAVLGTILPEIATQTGLKPSTPVLCGIHDSNASLYPYILTQPAPFSVVSTGTWVIAMAIGGAKVELDPTRDLLLNVNALGQAVPSARFMGGREFEIIRDGYGSTYTSADISKILADDTMLLPAIVPDTGPFQGMQARWVNTEPALGSGERIAALSFYLALMTATCLKLIGSQGPIIVEGPFAQNQAFLQMLNAATHQPVTRSTAKTGTGIGAALLFAKQTSLPDPVKVGPSKTNSEMQLYADIWRNAVEPV